MTELGGMFLSLSCLGQDGKLMIVASSDATNLKNTTAVVNGDKITLSGHKWVSFTLFLSPSTL
jgi:hypothetical protein